MRTLPHSILAVHSLIASESLQATFVRNAIFHALRESHSETIRLISSNFVYEYPTIDNLAFYLSSIVLKKHESDTNAGEAKREELVSLVAKYTELLPELRISSTARERNGSGVLLTGSTGSLGSNILARLIQNEEVAVVYAMSRPTSEDLDVKTRHARAFKREGLGVELLSSSKVHFIVGDASHRDLGLSTREFREVRAP